MKGLSKIKLLGHSDAKFRYFQRLIEAVHPADELRISFALAGKQALIEPSS
jgi:hypothetical protein